MYLWYIAQLRLFKSRELQEKMRQGATRRTLLQSLRSRLWGRYQTSGCGGVTDAVSRFAGLLSLVLGGCEGALLFQSVALILDKEKEWKTNLGERVHHSNFSLEHLVD